MYIEKRFLNVFLSVVLILCSLFSVQLISVSAEEKSNAKESNLTEAVLPELITSISKSVSNTYILLGSKAIYKEAKVGNVTVKCGEKVVVPLELDSINNSAMVGRPCTVTHS